MWLYRTRGREVEAGGDGAQPSAAQAPAPQLARAYGDFYDRYWSRMFGIAQADNDRLAQQIRETGQSLDLTTAARSIVLDRLRHGPQLGSRPAPDGRMPQHVVRSWDPTAIWCQSDRTVVIVPNPRPGHPYVASVGEIISVDSDHVVMQVDGNPIPQVCALGIGGGGYGRKSPEVEMARLVDAPSEDAQVDYCLWRYGDHIVGRVLHALEADGRFVELEGQWFLSELAARPDEEDLIALARAIFANSGPPMTATELATRLPRFAPASIAEHFGLVLSMRERRDLFTNVGTFSHPRWTLAGPPPMPFVAQRAAFDPDTYEILCVAGEVLSFTVARRLWDTGLLREVLGSSLFLEPAPLEMRGSFEERLSKLATVPQRSEPAAPPRERSKRSRGWFSFGRR